MENNNKKNIFSKRNIIIFICVLMVLLLLLIYFMSSQKNKDKIMNCTMSMSYENLFNLDMDMTVKYTDYVDSIEGKIYYKFLNEELKNNTDKFKESLSNSYKDLNSIYVNVKSEKDIIVIEYSINYDMVDKKELESFGFNFYDNESLEMTKDEFKKQILEGGGSCVEE